MNITNQIVIHSESGDTMTIGANEQGNIHIGSLTFKPEESEELLTHLQIAIETVKQMTKSNPKGGRK